ncbi:MAG: DUF262 domain-containing protein [Acidobacteria bacterium]|nr:DUF262 domain-containing protein [Acidobacteriota bacterium]
MAKAKLTVFLDHHIKRENLLYRRTTSQPSQSESRPQQHPYLTIRDLYGKKSKARLLRKPDFQRATWAWSPEECVELLESVLYEQVVPSVIMWLSPDNFQYVLDGGHRISVLLAWIDDDWGDRLPEDEYRDTTVQESIRKAAQRVRDLLREKKIGAFKEYLAADEIYNEHVDKGQIPDQAMDSASLSFARLVRRWEAVDLGFPILWVSGDYEKAEESFLKINKTGRSLSDWETKLVENRSSSFARAVMSIAQIGDVGHCWPIQEPEVANDSRLKAKAEQIIQKVKELHTLLFEPPYSRPVTELKQPLMATPYTRPEMKPWYLAELLTITEGKKGQKPETEALIKKDRNAPVSHIITNGLKLIDDAIDVIGNLYGSSPRSLCLMPLVYFYNKQGDYIRSLFYGMIYWLNHGSETLDVPNRKLVFSVHRRAFEEVLIQNKDLIITRIARRIGSGPEVTLPTARYFDGLLALLVKHNDQTELAEFQAEHAQLIATLGNSDLLEQEEEAVSPSRTFRGAMRTEVQVKELLGMFAICEICGGRYHPSLFTELDHKKQHSKGGKTAVSNARSTHPFCNNRREKIEELLSGAIVIDLPVFDYPNLAKKPEQLKFLFFEEGPTASDGGEEENEDMPEDFPESSND